MSTALPRPDDFFTPGLDQGLSLLRPEDLTPRVIDRVTITATVLGSNVAHRLATRAAFARLDREAIWSQSVVFPDVLALAENLSFQRKRAKVNDKFLLLGAAGDRLRFAVHMAARAAGQEHVERDIANHLAAARVKAGPLPVTDATDWRSLPLVIETRNFFNFYHFTRETLPALTLVARYGLTGPFHIVGPKSEERAFVRESVATWFPDLAARVSLVSGDLRYLRALVVVPVKSLYRQSNHRHIPAITTVAKDVIPRRPVVATAAAMSLNAVEDSVMALRDHCLSRITPAGRTRRIYVARRSGRQRRVVGEELLLAALAPLGFETVYFEDMSVAAQAQIMQECEAVVALHGAGVTNMLFAAAGCHVTKLSNLQTMRKRFGDFNALALASGARYHHIFLDHDFEHPDTVPNIARDGHRGVRISSFEAEAIAAGIHAKLAPATFAAAFATCRACNDAGPREALPALLDRHAGILAHTADYHVWRANTFSTAGRRGQALPHLRRAMVIEPVREALLRRILQLAHALGAEAVFLEAMRSYHALSSDKAEAFCAAQNWPAEPLQAAVLVLPL